MSDLDDDIRFALFLQSVKRMPVETQPVLLYASKNFSVQADSATLSAFKDGQ